MSSRGGYADSVASSSVLSSVLSTRRSTRASGSASVGELDGTYATNGRRMTRSNAGESSAQSTRAPSVVEVTEEMVEDERNKLLVQKQIELDQIFNRHDDLVCSSLMLGFALFMVASNSSYAKTSICKIGKICLDMTLSCVVVCLCVL